LRLSLILMTSSRRVGLYSISRILVEQESLLNRVLGQVHLLSSRLHLEPLESSACLCFFIGIFSVCIPGDSLIIEIKYNIQLSEKILSNDHVICAR
jgi:hypothetical protein